ncbi:Gfo/Idh/MocA family protein [Calycomorphotria hydatis]|uniref:Inositol 2-dehydrogenase n=1 Tax=Calycomorphotria hydatis TaxID=2528027 RepID=A0A517T9M2_9PLAN|nr:Gfo/Idh/MocA family oxidoreductase [Calycomorphotria hydatis]QDT65066.1 Inositol 2-dehydrogenase [Calycomorphotria hydatis]
MSLLTRREMMANAAAVGAAVALPWSMAIGQEKKSSRSAANDINLGLIGAGNRGGQVAGAFRNVAGTKIAMVADPDESRSGMNAEKFKAEAVTDLRRIIDNDSIDAVIVTTCNHWHCLAAIWAIQAGKDVYVEKPLSHTQWEGRKVVEAARKYGRIVQVGTQQRTDPMQAEVKQFLHTEKVLGKPLSVQANRLGIRGPIGKRDTPLPIPEGVDYDLWLGPAADEPLYRSKLHYDWHWDWNTGSGEMGNWGVHILDDIRNVVYQDEVSLPKRIIAGGGRLAWNDAGNTPNVHFAYFETDSIPTTIALSNLPNAPGSKKRVPIQGPGSGYVVFCEGGEYHGRRGGGTAYDKDGKVIRKFNGNSGGGHQQNFADAIRAENRELLNAEVEVGHYSTGWCNLANVGFQVGGAFTREKADAINASTENWDKLLDQMSQHVGNYGISLTDDAVSLGPVLEHDPQTELFTGENAESANHFLKRTYRNDYVVPEQV